MKNAKDATVPLGGHFRLFSELCSSTDLEKENMLSMFYSNVVGSVMYTMICTRPNLSYAINVLNVYMPNPGGTYWKAMKWSLRFLKFTSNEGLIINGVREM